MHNCKNIYIYVKPLKVRNPLLRFQGSCALLMKGKLPLKPRLRFDMQLVCQNLQLFFPNFSIIWATRS